jgi:Flp pilus assembly pilin Flp
MPFKLQKIWLKNSDGATAVEFALVGVPFIFMVVGIIEMALMFTTQSLLEASTAEAARQVRIGAVQQGGGEDLFKQELCDFASVFISCEDLQYQVVALGDFGDAQDFPEASFDEDGNLEDQQFDPGGVSDVVMIRTAYKYTITTPMMHAILTNNSDDSRYMLSTIVLQTEPYEFED